MRATHKIPEEMLSLITRKVQHLRRELERRVVGVKQAVYSKLHKELLVNIKARRSGQALDTVPVSASFFRVRLWTQKDLLEQLFAHYDHFDDDMKAELPLKRIWIVAAQEEG